MKIGCASAWASRSVCVVVRTQDKASEAYTFAVFGSRYTTNQNQLVWNNRFRIHLFPMTDISDQRAFAGKLPCRLITRWDLPIKLIDVDKELWTQCEHTNLWKPLDLVVAFCKCIKNPGRIGNAGTFYDPFHAGTAGTGRQARRWMFPGMSMSFRPTKYWYRWHIDACTLFRHPENECLFC